MALSVTVSQVRRIAATGRIYLRFTDGVILDFVNFQEVKDWAQDTDLDINQAKDLLRRLGIRYYLYRDPTGANPAVIEGKTITLDLSVANPLMVL